MTYQSLTKPTNGLATAALVLGIIGAVVALFPVINAVAAIMAVLAIVFGIIGLTRAKRVSTGRGRSIAGLILAVVALVTVPTINAAFFNATDIETVAEQPAIEEAPESEPAEPEAPVVEEPEPAPEPEEPSLTVSQEQAVISADGYLFMGGFSRSGLIGQLEYEGFSTDDATFAVDSLDVDWSEQAALSAAGYMDMGGFSAQSLLDQLLYEGFTQKQAAYGVGSVGF